MAFPLCACRKRKVLHSCVLSPSFASFVFDCLCVTVHRPLSLSAMVSAVSVAVEAILAHFSSSRTIVQKVSHYFCFLSVRHFYCFVVVVCKRAAGPSVRHT